MLNGELWVPFFTAISRKCFRFSRCWLVLCNLCPFRKKNRPFETNQPRVKVGVSENAADFLVTVA